MTTIEKEEPAMDMSKLKGPERIAVAGGAVLLLASVLPWYRYVGYGVTGWGSGGLAALGILFGLAGPAVMAYAVLRDEDFKIGPLAAPQAALVAAVVGVALILLRLVTSLGFTSIGIYLAVIGAGVAAYGSYGAVRSAGLSVPLVDRVTENTE